MIPNPYRGCFFVFEGIDGCGKTSQLEMTRKWISPLDLPSLLKTIVSKEPSEESL